MVHDLSDGGLVAAAAEMALASNVGVELNATSHDARPRLPVRRGPGPLPDRHRAIPTPIVAAAHAAGVNVALAGQAGGTDFACHDLFRI